MERQLNKYRRNSHSRQYNNHPLSRSPDRMSTSQISTSGFYSKASNNYDRPSPISQKGHWTQKDSRNETSNIGSQDNTNQTYIMQQLREELRQKDLELQRYKQKK